jgi:hypothetical protein
MSERPSPAMKISRDLGYLARIVFISWRTSSYLDWRRSYMGGMYSLCGTHVGATRGRSSSLPLLCATKNFCHRLERLVATSGESK